MEAGRSNRLHNNHKPLSNHRHNQLLMEVVEVEVEEVEVEVEVEEVEVEVEEVEVEVVAEAD